MPRVKTATLLLDFNLYPRHKINPYNVKEIANAIESGANIPSIIVDRNSKRVIDGFHRVRAYEKLFKESATIEVEWRQYATEAEMFLDAIVSNASHGDKLSKYDRVRCQQIAEQFKIEPDVLAPALSCTVEVLEEIKITKEANYKGLPIPLKATVRHLAGKNISDKQFNGIKKAGGHPIVFYVNQVLNALEKDLVDWLDHRHTDSLLKLYDVLGNSLREKELIK